MVNEPLSIDISAIPELERLAKEVAVDGRPRMLRAHDINLAILSPIVPAQPDADRTNALPQDERDAVLAELESRRKRGLSVTEMTAGILRSYAKSPSPTPREEKDAFEQAVADQVVESMGGTWPASHF